MCDLELLGRPVARVGGERRALPADRERAVELPGPQALRGRADQRDRRRRAGELVARWPRTAHRRTC